MAEQQTIEEIATDPKVRGRLQALRAVVDDVQAQIVTLREKITTTAGARHASERIAHALVGVADEIRKFGERGDYDVEETKVRVGIVARCRDVALASARDGEREATLLEGEARALQRQLNNVRKLHAATVAEEQRKVRIESEDRGTASPSAEPQTSVDEPVVSETAAKPSRKRAAGSKARKAHG